MGKYDRIQKRRERKEHERMIREGEEKTKVRKQHENKMKTWRTDQQGNIIFKGAVKISKTALVALIAIVVIGVFFAVAILTNTETAGECANPFCHMFGIGEEGDVKYAPPTSGITEERELP